MRPETRPRWSTPSSGSCRSAVGSRSTPSRAHPGSWTADSGRVLPPGEARKLQRGGQGPVLVVRAWAVDGALTDLRLWLDWQMPRQSEKRARHHMMEMPGLTRMPRLHPPQGVALETRGRGGGGGRWNSEARVDTDLTVAELEAHFVRTDWSRPGGAGSLAAPTTWSAGVPGTFPVRVSGAASSLCSRPSVPTSGRSTCASRKRSRPTGDRGVKDSAS